MVHTVYLKHIRRTSSTINWRSTRYITRFSELLRKTLQHLVSQLHQCRSSNLKKGAGISTERCLIFLFLETVPTLKMTRWMTVYPWLVNISYKPDHPHEFLVQTGEAVRISHLKPNFSYKPDHPCEFLTHSCSPIWISHTNAITHMNSLSDRVCLALWLLWNT
jgi:hypothetical protein